MPEVTETPNEGEAVLISTATPVVASKQQPEPECSNRCVVPGCATDLTTEKSYNRRLKVCAAHLKAQSVGLEAGTSRFCQQCSRFHTVDAFDGTRRSCRDRLKTHNQRRKRRKETEFEATSAVPGQSTATDSSGSQHGPDVWGEAFYAPIHHQPQAVQFVPGGALYAAASVPAPQMLYPVRTVLAKDGVTRMWVGGVAESPNAFCYPGFRPIKIQNVSGHGRTVYGHGHGQPGGRRPSFETDATKGSSVPATATSAPVTAVHAPPQPCPVPYRLHCRESASRHTQIAEEMAAKQHRPHQILQPYPQFGGHCETSTLPDGSRGLECSEGFQVSYSLSMPHQVSNGGLPLSRPSDSTIALSTPTPWPPLRLRPPVFSSPPRFTP